MGYYLFGIYRKAPLIRGSGSHRSEFQDIKISPVLLKYMKGKGNLSFQSELKRTKKGKTYILYR